MLSLVRPRAHQTDIFSIGGNFGDRPKSSRHFGKYIFFIFVDKNP
ncbi:hypothetical protein MHK_000669 [Candidatus Magnetomorum sp. HK-1]|nr:hypothetical protein MHK_000669 [Candidatus Magnetomorum sp. HK-1]